MKNFQKLFFSFLFAFTFIFSIIQAQETMPSLSIPQYVIAETGESAFIPVNFDAGANIITAIAFSIDYDETALDYDDISGFNCLDSSAYTCTLVDSSPSDTDGELDFTITSTDPAQGIPNGDLISIPFNVDANVAESTVVPVAFSVSPQPSFGNSLGQSVSGTASDGSFLIFNLVPNSFELVSVSTDGVQGNDNSFSGNLSGNGRYLVFLSRADNLAPEDTDEFLGVFLRDLVSGETVHIASIADSNTPSSARKPHISANGRWIVFHSYLAHVPDDTNSVRDTYLYDIENQTFQLVSQNGNIGDVDFSFHSSSYNACYVVYTLNNGGVYSYNRLTDTSTVIDENGIAGVTSANGEFVAYTNRTTRNLYLYQRSTGTSRKIDSGSNYDFSISADGSLIVYQHRSRSEELYAYNTQTGVRTLLTPYISQTSGLSRSFNPQITADGSYVVFGSFSQELVPGPDTVSGDVFVYEMATGIIQRLSLLTDGSEPNDRSDNPFISQDGMTIGFHTYASNYVASDTNEALDLLIGDYDLVPSPIAIPEDDCLYPQYSSNSAPDSTITLTGESGTTQSQTLNISNVGDAGSALNVTQVGIMNDFTISTLPTLLMPSDGEFAVTLTCDIPSSGSITETLTLETNEIDAQPYSYTLVCEAEDPPPNTVPVIGLIGENPITVIKNASYSDAGATASDSEDGDLTASIVTTGSVDTSTIGQYIITYSVTDSDDNTVQTSRTINVIAGDSPQITVNGENPVNIQVGDSYVDAGAIANDTEDGNITDFIISSGTVDTSTVGQYIITYSVTDSSDNTTQASRTVNVTSNDIPVISVIGDNPVSIIKNASYVDAGATASDTEDGDLTASIVTTGNVDTSSVGQYIITYSVTDSDSNTVQTSRTIDVVTGDTPQISINGLNPVNIQVGDSYVDAGATASDTEDGDLTASIVTTGSVDTNIVGQHTITYSVTDSAGNTASATRTVVVEAMPDVTAPVITILGENPATIVAGNAYVDAGATAVDAVDGVVGVSVSSTVDTTTPNTYSVTYTASDSAGNTASATRTVVVEAMPDLTAPVITILGENPATIVAGNAYVDAGATAVDAVDGVVVVSVISTVDTSTANTYTVTYTASDSAGNTASATRTVIVTSADDNVSALETCWFENPNDNTSSWQITNPNSVPLIQGTQQKIVYSWEVFDTEGNVLQSAENWDQTGSTRVNTVLAYRIVVSWAIFDNSLSTPIGTVESYANDSSVCNN